MSSYFDSTVIFEAAESHYGRYTPRAISPFARLLQGLQAHRLWFVYASCALCVFTLSTVTFALVKAPFAARWTQTVVQPDLPVLLPAQSQSQSQVLSQAFTPPLPQGTPHPLPPALRAQQQSAKAIEYQPNPASKNQIEQVASSKKTIGNLPINKTNNTTNNTVNNKVANMQGATSSFVSYRNTANAGDVNPLNKPSAQGFSDASIEHTTPKDLDHTLALTPAPAPSRNNSNLPALNIVGIPLKGTVLIRTGSTIKPFSLGQELPTGEKLEDADPAVKKVRTNRRELTVTTM